MCSRFEPLLLSSRGLLEVLSCLKQCIKRTMHVCRVMRTESELRVISLIATAGGIPAKTGIAYEAARSLLQEVARTTSAKQEKQIAEEGLIVLEGRATVSEEAYDH